MVTGIIEEVGMVSSLRLGEEEGRISIRAKKVLVGTRIGDSICVNGVCLTVTRIFNDGFEADVMPETVKKTALSALHAQSLVNLERAMEAGGRLGGHIVQGHVDGVGVISDRRQEGNAVVLRIRAEEDILALVAYKGSIAIDGVSLTVAGLFSGGFMVGIIPHTGEETILLKKKPGELVNLETDVIGKYVAHLLGRGEASWMESRKKERPQEERGSKKYGRENTEQELFPGGLTLEALEEMGF